MNILYNQTLLKNFFYIYTLLFILFLVYFFTDIAVIGTALSFLALGVLIISWLFASRLFKMIGMAFTAAGIILSLASGESAFAIISNTTSNMPLLFFFSVLPWIGTVVKVGGLDDSISDMIQDDNNKVENIYGRSVFATYFLGVFLNISAIYIVQQILENLFKKATLTLRNEFIIKTTLRAFALAVIWSPLEVIVGMTVGATGLSYFALFPWLLLVSITTGIVEVFIGKKDFRGITLDADKHDTDKNAMTRSIIKMLVLLVSFLSLVMVLNTFSDIGFIMSVALIIIPFSFATAIVMQKFEYFIKGGVAAWRNHNNTLQNFAVLFLSLGIFSEGFNSSPLPQLMQTVFGYFDGVVILILLMIMAVIYALAMFGVHPVATLAILAEVLSPIMTPDNVMSIAITMVVCGMSISAAAPYGINATMTSQKMGLNPYHITKTNMSFSLRMGLIGILFSMAALII
ncbi:hypothetical protein [Salinicoccus albus]|uniref:hypothetical protein n=1 Tax=Salinicoccus albus TaxID=418756 RepID=UPI00037C142F|nr:hypothetical protein [Salinicoccus albus]